MKVLIIRFSSFGDIVQAMSCLDDLSLAYRDLEVHWLVRSDLSEVVAFDSRVNVISYDRKGGWKGLMLLAKELREHKFDIVYDAHLSLRSRILKLLLKPLPLIGPKWIVRSKERIKRFFLFKLGINFFPSPYKGMDSYRNPLNKIGIRPGKTLHPKWNIAKMPEYKDKVVLCPSAAWEMKRWPVDHWKKLIQLLPDKQFVILGGPQDHFCEDIANVDRTRVQNLAGKLSLKESCLVVASAAMVVSADTGLIHVADLLGVSGISLMGPTAFGFCSNDNIVTMGVDLKCRPCTKDGRGSCSQDVYQKCMVEIAPEMVASKVSSTLISALK